MFTTTDRRRIASASFALLVAFVMLLAVSSNALASGTVNLSDDKTVLTYDGADNTQSLLKVTYNGVAYVLEETKSGATTTAGSGCTQINTRKVSCASVEVVAINLNMAENTVVSPTPPADTDSVTMGSTAGIPSYVLTTIKDVGAVTAGDGPVDVYANDNGTINGGPGYDNIRTDGSINPINGGDKDDHITIKNAVITPAGTEFSYGVSGGPGHDMIDASASSANFLYSHSPGTDVVIGGTGSDEFTFGTDRDLVFGGPGNDRFYDTGTYNNAEANLSEVWGGEGDDVFTDMMPTRLEVTHFEGGPGKDKVTYRTSHSQGWDPDIYVSLDEPADDGVIGFGGPSEGDHHHISVEEIGGYVELTSSDQMGGNDTLVGSAMPNRIDGEDGNDTIYGEAGNDVLLGGEGSDAVYGGDGDDVFEEAFAEYYSDSLFGEAGNDLFKSSATGDSFDGGIGEDRVTYAGAQSAIVIDLDPMTFSPEPLEAIENATGSPFSDTIFGNDGPNKVDGADGDDTFDMIGGGVDEITCGAGVDTVDADTTDVIIDPLECETVNLQ